jgi:hypothetical protein
VLRSGGGNAAKRKAGPGRPPSVVRAAYTHAFDKRLVILERIADGKMRGVRIADRINAIRTMGMFGPGVGNATLDEKLRANNTPREVRFVFVDSPKVKR